MMNPYLAQMLAQMQQGGGGGMATPAPSFGFGAPAPAMAQPAQIDQTPSPFVQQARERANAVTPGALPDSMPSMPGLPTPNTGGGMLSPMLSKSMFGPQLDQQGNQKGMGQVLMSMLLKML